MARRLTAVLMVAALAGVQGESLRVYLGTYTGGASEGIYVTELDLDSGRLSEPALAAAAVNPSFLAIHPNRKWLYAVSEVGEYQGEAQGGMLAFAIDNATGKLALLNEQGSGGGAPCHLVVDRTGRHVLVANYSGGNVASLPILEDGTLGKIGSLIQHEGSSVNPNRQKGPHAHSINLDAHNRYAVAADLGLDRLLVYKFNATTGALGPAALPWAAVEPGAGPRHFAFHPSYRFAYVINELASTVTVFDYGQRTGLLSSKQTLSTLPAEFRGNNSTAEVQVHPTGNFVYGSNRGHNSIAVFRVNASTGELQPVEIESTRGEVPRNFGVDPTGRYLLAANQRTDSVVVFRIDDSSGALVATGHRIAVPSPVCVKFLAMGK